MDDKITIIEGPPPTFEAVGDAWALGLNESPLLSHVALTRLRTYNGPALVERCHHAWQHYSSIHLEYRGTDGLQNWAPILAARTLDIDEGQLLLLWVRLDADEVELENDDNELDDDGFDNRDDSAGL